MNGYCSSNNNPYQIPDVSLVMVYKISPFLQAHRGNIQKIPNRNQDVSRKKALTFKEKKSVQSIKEKNMIDARKQQIKQKIKMRIKQQIDTLLKNNQKDKLSNLISSSPQTQRCRTSLNVKLHNTPDQKLVIEPQTPNCIKNQIIKKSILFESTPSRQRQRNVKSSLDKRHPEKSKPKREPIKMNPYNYRRSMSTDIRIKVKSKPKTAEGVVRKKLMKKQEIGILPWDIEHPEEEFDL